MAIRGAVKRFERVLVNRAVRHALRNPNISQAELERRLARRDQLEGT